MLNAANCFYGTELRKYLDLLDDDDNAKKLNNTFWTHTDSEARISIGEFVNTSLLSLGGMTQNHVAEILAVCPGAITAWKKGQISATSLLRLMKLVEILTLELPAFPRLPEDVGDMVSAMMNAMRELARMAGEVGGDLTEDIYACVRAAAGSKIWWQSRATKNSHAEDRIALELMHSLSVTGRSAAWFRTVVDLWCPIYLVCVDFVSN